MPKSKDQKKTIVDDLVKRFIKGKSLVFFHFDGLSVDDIEKLRKKCREEGVDYVVAKKTLLKIAFQKSSLDINLDNFHKGIATAIGYEDEVAPARIVETFAKDHSFMQTVGGVLEKKFVDAAKIKELSKLLSKKELLAKLVGSLQAPISGIVNVLSGNLRGLVQVLRVIEGIKK